MSSQCQKIEIKKLPFYASDITNFTSAVCAVVTQMSSVNSGSEPLFTSWAATYSGDLYNTFTTVNTYSATWGGGGGNSNVNTFVYSNSANILQSNSVVNTTSGNWNSVYTSYNSSSASFLTNDSGNSRYVKLSGDVMTGGLSAPSLSTNNLYVAGSTINFFDGNGNVIQTLKSSDVGNFKSNYTLTNSRSANWENTYVSFSSQSANNLSVYNTVNTNSGSNWNYQGSDLKALTGNWQNTYTGFSSQSANNLSVYNTVNSKSANWDSTYSTVNTNSATNWNYQGTDIKSLSSNWQNTYTGFSSQSANNLSVYNSFNSNSSDYNSVYSTVNTNSGSNWNYQGTDIKSLTSNWQNTYTNFSTQSSNNLNVYSIVSSNSATNWNYQGNDIKALTGNWDRTYTNFSTQSANNLSLYTTVNTNSATNWNYQGNDIKTLTANWQNTYTTVSSYSAAWGTGGSPQTLSFNASNAQLTISDGNTVSLSALSGSSSGGSGIDTAVRELTSNWQNTYVSFSSQSANNLSVYNTVNINSGSNWNYQGNDIKSLTANWQNTYSTVSSNSATNWNYQGNDIKALTANWQASYTALTSSSANWNDTRNTVQTNSATNWNYQGNDIKVLTGNWDQTYTNFSSQSANNLSVYTTVQTNSATNWNYQGLDIKALTGNWQNTYSTVSSNSATNWNYQGNDIKALTGNWQNTYTNFSAQSANNLSVYTTVQTNSATNWNYQGNDIKSLTGNWQASYTALTSSSANWNDTRNTVQTNSATNWNYQGTDLKALTGNWQNTYIGFSSQSANNFSVYSSFNSNSSNYNSVYSTVNTNSATNWNYQGNDIKALTGNWQNTYSTVSSNSALWGTSDRLNNGTVQVVLSSDNNLHFPTGTIGDTLLDGGFTIVGKPGSYAELASYDGNVFAWASDISYGNPVGGGFSIGTDTTTASAGYVWTFGNNGLLRFPDGTIQSTAFTDSLAALDDVSIPSPVNGQVLTYNSITNKWNAGTPLSASGATGYYGSFYDTTAQTLTSTTQAKRINIAQTYEHNGVSIDTNRIVFNYNGVYELIYSIQYKNTDASQQDIYIWLKQNGVDIPNSSSVFTIPARKNASIPAQLIAVTPFMSTLTAGDFIELYWHCNSTAVTVETFTTHANPTIPDTPGVIVAVKQVTNVQIVPTVGAYLPLSGGKLTGNIGINNDPLYFNIDSTNIGNSYGDFGIGSSSNITINPNANLILTQNVGNVGIGTITPATKLDVNGVITVTGGNSDQWNNVYSSVNTNSANWNYQGSDIKSLTGNWQNTYSNFSTQSANNLSVYTNVNTNSATNWNYQGTDIKSLTGNWQNTYSTVNTNSANWNYQGSDIKSLTGNWENTYSTVNTNSATNWNYQGSDIKSLTGNWQNTYSNFSTQSANNLSVYTNVNTNSANWNYQGSDIKSLTGNWQNTYSTVNSNSASWAPGTVTSVGLSSVNSTLTIGSTPITGSGIFTADLNLAKANTWTGQQTFNSMATVHGVGVITPTIIGGNQTNSSLVIKSTSIAGSADYINFQTGSNATAMHIGTNGYIGINSVPAGDAQLYVTSFDGPQYGVQVSNYIGENNVDGIAIKCDGGDTGGSFTGSRYGVYATNLDATYGNAGVYGSGIYKGVHGTASDSTGKGVYGTATGSTGNGVYGIASGSTGAGGYFTNSGSGYALIADSGNSGFGTTSPATKLHIRSTSNQFRAGYDTSNYLNINVGSTGIVTYDAVGSGAVHRFSENIQVPLSGYYNFGTTDGSAGYGFRDNAGVVEVKNSGGSWIAVGGSFISGGSEFLASDFTTSSTTAVSSNLGFAIAANEAYVVTITGTASKATSNTGLKLAIGAPTGCTISGEQYGSLATLAAFQTPSLITAINTLGATFATGIGIQVTFRLAFRVTNGSTAGNITLQCATVTSNVATIYAGTRMTYTKATSV